MAIAQFSGVASGIDSASLIDAIIEAKESVNILRRNEIDALDAENSALEELNTKLLALDEVIDKFRTINGGGVSKKASSSDSTVATAVVGASAVNASYSLTVTSVADTATGSFDHQYGASTDYVSTSGSGDVTISVGSGAEQVDITVAVTANSTTLDAFAAALNSDENNEGLVHASVVNIGTSSAPDYRLLFTTLHQGTARGQLALAADVAITELAASSIDLATNAVFSIQGIGDAITRETNAVSDVISGVTFQLTKAGSANISISTDPDGTADAFNEIVNAYNDIVSYINENDLVERVEEDEEATNVYGSLAKTRIDDDFLAAFKMALLETDAENGTAVTSMAELGISTNRDGTISIDTDKFKEAVGNDPTGATEILNGFADAVSGTSGVIYQYTKFNGFIDLAQLGNENEIKNISDTIKALERRTDSLRSTMEKSFARLETIVGDLQSQQQALSGILAGLS